MGKKCFRRAAVKRIFVVCEGQTEVNFVKRLLTPYFVSQTKIFIPVTVLTKRDNRQGKMYKGGMSSFAKAHITIEKTLANLKDKDTFVTTMFDFYKLPSDTPGMDKMTDINDSYEKVELLENEIRTFDIKRLTFDAYFPYIQLHEFESFLFADLDRLAEAYFDYNIESLRECSIKIKNPELINNGEDTAPSKRILSCIPDYDKVVTGISILEKIGIKRLKEVCKHFSEWIKKLEQL